MERIHKYLSMKCKQCGGELSVNPRPDTTHYAELRCKECGRFIKWIPKPFEDIKRKPADIRKVMHFYKITKEFCFFCGRTKKELGINECLTIDHIIPLVDGGKDEPCNMQILCSACHRLKHWINLYVTKHLVRLYVTKHLVRGEKIETEKHPHSVGQE